MRDKTKRHPIADPIMICDYFRITNTKRKDEIKALIHRFEQEEGSYCSLCTFHTRSFIYVSPSFQEITGYPMDYLAVNGYDFFMSITAKESIPYIMMRQAQYIKQMHNSRFNYRKPNPVEFNASFVHKGGEVVPVSQVSVMLDYEPGGDIRTFFAVWICIQNQSKEALKKRKIMLWEMLKDLHRLIFSPATVSKEKKISTELLVSLKTPETNVPKLSPRERELLLLLAKGQSLKEVAHAMKISYTTAETHRKKLFKKFKTRNVAQLIKKASKIFWLE